MIMKLEEDCDEMLVKAEGGRAPLQDLVPVVKTENLKVEVKDEIEIFEEAIDYKTSGLSAYVSDAHSSNNQEFSRSVVETRSGEEHPGTKVECYGEENDRVKSDCITSDSVMAETCLSARVLVCKLCNLVSTDCKCQQRCGSLYSSAEHEDDTGEHPNSPSPQCSVTYTCGHCGISYVVKSDLIQHISTHGPKQTHYGNMTGRSLSCKRNLILHKKHSLVHTFSCELCSKPFSRKNDFIRHRRIHFGERPFSCDLCSKLFIQKSHLITNRRTHSGEQRPFSS